MLESVNAINFIHWGLHTVHRDIKPDNIVFSMDNSIQIIDFGCSKILQKGDEIITKTGNKGTPIYMAPELYKWIARKKTLIDLFACDIWSLGITFYEMLARHLPFEGNFRDGSFIKNVKGDASILPLPQNTPKFFKSLIEEMLVKDPIQRISSDQVLERL